MMHARQISPSETHHLRHKVLWPHLAAEEECVIDIDERSDAIHLGTFEGERLISIGSIFQMKSEKLKDASQFRLRAMATDPEFQGRNAGRMLVEKAIQLLQKKGGDVLWCDARLRATGFYESLGFKKLPEVYEVKLIGPHQFMWFELQKQSE